MSYPRVNTTTVGAAGAVTDQAVTVKLPNAQTGALPLGQAGQANPIGAGQRWRIRGVVASYSPASAGGRLTVTDGQFTWSVDVNGCTPLLPLDIQCAAGAEVDITLAAVTGALGCVNVSAVSEG